MKLRNPILSPLTRPLRPASARRLLIAAALVLTSLSAFAKDAPATVVVLFDSAQGAAYVQITGMTVNGKTEFRVCDGVPKFDRNAFDALPHAGFFGASLLERGTDGVLTLTVNAKPVCVVPASLKFDKKPELTPSEAADQAVLQGVPVTASGSDLSLPALKAGVQVVFVAAPDAEYAEFLRTRRANTLKDFQSFLARYPSSSHAAEARDGMAAIHQKSAEAALAEYRKSTAGGKPDLAPLSQAGSEAQAAIQAAPGFSPAVKLMINIGHELDGLLDIDRARLHAYQKALESHAAGYSQLAAARAHVHQLLEVRPDYAPALNLRRDIASEEQKLEGAVANAESLAASGRYDEAMTSLGPYVYQAAENQRIDRVIGAIYKAHFDSGQRLAGQQDWEHAVAEFRKAAAVRADNKEAAAALNNANAQLTAKRDQQEANLAVLQSNEYAQKGQYVEAYNVLADLSDAQRALVSSQLAALSRNYVPAATRRAQKLQEVHVPIKGRADEDAVREAYVLLDRASTLSGDPAVTLKRDFLSNKISSYYIDQANHYLEKPSGSGAGVGWLYLQEAQRFGITNANALKDEMARYSSLYQRRSRLSVGIVLRDQTSRSDSPGFADQMADAIANGLESSGIPVDVVRKASDATDGMQPNFMLLGEVLEHRVVRNANLETPQSKYRAGTHEVKTAAWQEAKSAYDAAVQQVAAAQQALTDAQGQHKKKEVVAAAADALQAAQKNADDLKRKMDANDQNRVEAIVETYHYTKKNIDLSGSVELAFRISDRSGSVLVPTVSVRKQNQKSAVVLQDVKPDDTEGVTNQGVEPDEHQFLTELEIEARTALVKAVAEKAVALSDTILREARSRVQRGDLDGAAEEYVLFMNATSNTPSPERDEAAKFLRDRFNLSASFLSTSLASKL